MEIKMGETNLRCYEDGKIERFHKQKKEWTFVKGYNRNGYLRIEIENKHYSIHRIIYKCFNPQMDETLFIDHINRIPNDNRIENLRLVTNQQNNFNTDAKGYSKHGNGFKGRIRLNGVLISKTFKTEDEARAWYLEQKTILHII
jgi:hypothetical protein